jgi:ribonuclease E
MQSLVPPVFARRGVPETFMAKKMLIDTGHPEETRVVVVSGNRIEEFDFESAARKQLKGNIYLAKVTRVEPSLQAAFVEYGGNRHGFLAFSEIHPDYYQIPVADRERLLRQEAEESRRIAEEANDGEDSEGGRGRRGARRGAKRNGRRRRPDTGRNSRKAQSRTELDPADLLAFADFHLAEQIQPETRDSTAHDEAAAAAGEPEEPADPDSDTGNAAAATGQPDDEGAAASDEGEALLRTRSHWTLAGDEDAPGPETAGAGETDTGAGGEALDPDMDDEGADAGEAGAPAEGEEAETTTFNELTADEEAREELARRPRVRLRDYKIQEVIKRRQIMLVQVVKEERGNKGAALTTYLSLAGRYCVLMPNTPRGGGISRKITNAADRKRLKAIASELDVPEGMGLIIRTAGANRTKAEIRRDYEYLLRLWESVRELTLQSSAPCLVYEEGSLIKRSIRDLYSREIDTVQVEGEEGYKEAKAFMRMLMPSHAKNVQSYKDRIPLFQRYQVEQQLDAMLNPQVQLPSGGYIVLNPTEALVAIDVNSGKSTKEHNIEDTALRTNLEAAEEIARQLRLRDLAGLIVIDFIDMEEPRNNRAVERKLKDCLKQDRARIQTGRISMFGLLEMSRQRLRPGMMEISTVTCEECQGTGIVRSVESAALRILRACEEEGLRQRTQDITVPCAPDVANYLLNFKRHQLMDIELRYGVTVFIEADAAAGRDAFELKRGEPMSEGRRQALNEQAVRLESAFGLDAEMEMEPAPVEVEAVPAREQKPKARRGDRKRRKDEVGEATAEATAADDQAAEDAGEKRKAAESGDGAEPKRRRRRGKRGGRRHRKTPETEKLTQEAAHTGEEVLAETVAPEGAAQEQGADDRRGEPVPAEVETAESRTAGNGKGRKRPKKKAEPGHPEPEIPGGASVPLPEEEHRAAAKAGKANGNGAHGHEEHADKGAARDEEDSGREETHQKAPSEAASISKPKTPTRRGWWQRRSF